MEPQPTRQQKREYAHRRRLAAIAKLGNCCKHCGIIDWRVLQVDHIKGGGSREIRAIGNSSVYGKILRMSHPETEYQVLCANCNWIKRYERKETKPLSTAPEPSKRIYKKIRRK